MLPLDPRRRSLTPFQLLQLAQPNLAPLQRGPGPSAGGGGAVPRAPDKWAKLLESVMSGMALGDRERVAALARERFGLQKETAESQIAMNDARLSEMNRFGGVRDKLSAGIQQAGLPSLVGDESSGAYSPPMGVASYMASPEAGALLARLDPSAFAKRFVPKATYSTIQNPYGRGGAAQVESGSGKFVNYQGPVKTPAPTLAQQANAIEIQTARNRITALKVKPGDTLAATVLRHSLKQSDTGRDNPLYDPMIASDARKAAQRMVGQDPGYDSFVSALHAAQPTTTPGGIGNPAAPPPYQPPLREPIGAIPGSNSAQRTRATLDRIGPRQADLPAPAPFYSPAGREPIGAETLAETRARSRASMDKWRRAVDRTTMERSVEEEILNNPPTREPIGARGIGTHAQPYRPKTERAFRDIRSGDFYINPADGKVYRKK